MGFANILSKTHLSNNNAFTFAWAAPEVQPGCLPECGHRLFCRTSLQAKHGAVLQAA